MTDESSGGPSVWERELYGHLKAHVDTEREMLESYAKLAARTESKAFRYLAQLLVEEEKRHHLLFSQLADTLEAESLMTGEEPTVPDMDFRAADRDEVLKGANELLEREEQDIKELRRLRHEMRLVRDTSIWDLLVDLMERDTEKHIAILRFVRHHA